MEKCTGSHAKNLLIIASVSFMLALGLSEGLSSGPSHFPPNPNFPSNLGSFGTATVDGVRSPGEYGSCIGPVTPPYNLSGTLYTIIFCETNDGTNDYYYYEINDLTLDDNDRFYLLFDNLHDGTIPACGVGIPVEDAIGFIMPPPRPLPSPFIDMHYCGLPFTDEPPAGIDGSQHITAMGSFTSGVGYRFEFSHPLNSGDSEDYALSFGSTVGWCIYWRDASKPPPNIVEYPPDCYSVYAGSGSAGLYGHVVKQGEHTTTRTTVTVTTTRTTTATTTSIVTTTVVEPTVITSTTTATTTVPTTTTVTTRIETTQTTTATITTTRILETVTTVTSITTRTLQTTTTTTATTTSIVVDPMLEWKLYIVIALLLAIMGLIWWLYWKCCKKKGPFFPAGEVGPPPPKGIAVSEPGVPSDIAVSEPGVPSEKVTYAAIDSYLLGMEAVKDHVRMGRINEALEGLNSSRSNWQRYGQTVTDPSVQQAVSQIKNLLDNAAVQLRKGNTDEAIKLLDDAVMLGKGIKKKDWL